MDLKKKLKSLIHDIRVKIIYALNSCSIQKSCTWIYVVWHVYRYRFGLCPLVTWNLADTQTPVFNVGSDNNLPYQSVHDMLTDNFWI
jgi:hypothetical protein